MTQITNIEAFIKELADQLVDRGIANSTYDHGTQLANDQEFIEAVEDTLEAVDEA